MGVFDRVRCKYPLPDPEAKELEYQTKSTAAPYLDNYIVTPEGRLLHEEYDVRTEKSDEAPLGFYLHHENCRWVEVAFRGQLETHTSVEQPDGARKWYSYLLWFKDGRVADVQRGNQCGEIIAPVKPPKEASSATGTG